MEPDEELVRYSTPSRARHFWHRSTGTRCLCSGAVLARYKVETIRFGDMDERDKARICLKCLGADEYKAAAASIEAYRDGRIFPFGKRPLCPACQAKPLPDEARLKWWHEGRFWKCFACGARYSADMERLG